MRPELVLTSCKIWICTHVVGEEPRAGVYVGDERKGSMIQLCESVGFLFACVISDVFCFNLIYPDGACMTPRFE